jgi:hypothetical protein
LCEALGWKQATGALRDVALGPIELQLVRRTRPTSRYSIA